VPDAPRTDPPRPAGARRQKVGGFGDPEVFVADEQVAQPVDLARWQRLAADVLASEGVRGLAELAVIFVSEDEIAELNEEHMGARGPTDVLAFPIDAADVELVSAGQPTSRGPDRPPADPADVPLLLGDVVVCPAVAARQAPEHAGSYDDEIALLVVHGVLHVLGHDHDDADERARMRQRERGLLEALHWRGPAPPSFRQDHADEEALP
jgi:probable rRNA maturation factor